MSFTGGNRNDHELEHWGLGKTGGYGISVNVLMPRLLANTQCCLNECQRDMLYDL